MPVKQTSKGCFQWGNSGKIYCGKGAREKAAKQGKAAIAASYKKGK